MNRFLLVASCLSAPMMVGAPAWAQRVDLTLGDALTQPLRDLSILRPEPEEVLQRAAAAPYAIAATLPNGALDCKSVDGEIWLLDAALGEDVDAPTVLGTSLMAQATSSAGDALVGAVGDLVELPYRGVIRFITGAERRDREIQAAVQAGVLRRAFLKGLRARECATPRLLTVIEPMQGANVFAIAAEVPLSDLELARRQLAAANAAAASALPADEAARENALSVAAEIGLSDLELARRQLAASNAAAVSAAPALIAADAPAIENAPIGASIEIGLSDLELAQRQLAAANAAAAEVRLSDLELARRQLAAANAAAVSLAMPPADGETAPDSDVQPVASAQWEF